MQGHAADKQKNADGASKSAANEGRTRKTTTAAQAKARQRRAGASKSAAKEGRRRTDDRRQPLLQGGERREAAKLVRARSVFDRVRAEDARHVRNEVAEAGGRHCGEHEGAAEGRVDVVACRYLHTCGLTS